MVDVRHCNGEAARLPGYVDELIALEPDLLAGIDQVAQVIRRKTDRIPVVLTISNDPVDSGLVQGLAHPGTNVTEMAVLSPEVGAKQVEPMAEFLHRTKTLAMFTAPGVPGTAALAGAVRTAARAKGAQVLGYEVKDRASLEQAFGAMAHDRPDALLGTGGSGMLYGFRQPIAEHALRLRIAASGGITGQAEAGFLFTYGVKLLDVYRRAASHAARILGGADPAGMPVEQASTFERVVNLKTARALGLTIPPTIRLRADRFIE